MPPLLPILWWLVQGLDLRQQPVKVGPAVEPTIGDYGTDPLSVADVRERVGVEKDEIGELAGLDGAERVIEVQDARGVESGGLQGLQRRETGLDEPFELHVQADTGNLKRYSDVRPRQQDDAGLIRETNVLKLEWGDRTKDRLELPRRLGVEPVLPIAANRFGDELHAGGVCKSLFRMHDVMIANQIDGGCHAMLPVCLEGRRAGDRIPAVVERADVTELNQELLAVRQAVVVSEDARNRSRSVSASVAQPCARAPGCSTVRWPASAASSGVIRKGRCPSTGISLRRASSRIAK